MSEHDLIDQGRELLSAATPGDWWHYGDIAHEIFPDHALKSDHEVPPVAGVVERKEDAELIVWMRNNLPALLDELTEARQWAEWFSAQRDYLGREVAKDYVAIAEKQRRDNARVAELEAALEVKTAQHAETLGLLEHAYKAIEAQNRPPLGYTVLSKTEVRLMPGSFHYTASGPVTESILPAQKLAGERKGHRKKCVIAELREVSE